MSDELEKLRAETREIFRSKKASRTDIINATGIDNGSMSRFVRKEDPQGLSHKNIMKLSEWLQNFQGNKTVVNSRQYTPEEIQEKFNELDDHHNRLIPEFVAKIAFLEGEIKRLNEKNDGLEAQLALCKKLIAVYEAGQLPASPQPVQLAQPTPPAPSIEPCPGCSGKNEEGKLPCEYPNFMCPRPQRDTCPTGGDCRKKKLPSEIPHTTNPCGDSPKGCNNIS